MVQIQSRSFCGFGFLTFASLGRFKAESKSCTDARRQGPGNSTAKPPCIHVIPDLVRQGLRSLPGTLLPRAASVGFQFRMAPTEASCKEWEQAVEVLRQMSEAAPGLKLKKAGRRLSEPLYPRRWKLTSLPSAPSSVPARQTTPSTRFVSEQHCTILVGSPAGRRAMGFCVPWLRCRLL